MYLASVGLCVLAVIAAYFWNNPVGHRRWFILRRFIVWFPLGMTYAFLYMARLNLAVAKTALGPLIPNQDFGIIFAVGTVTYAVAFVINGPLVDRIGGKRGILIAAIGAALSNAALGLMTYLIVTGRARLPIVPAFSIAYAANMYFQSYGAASIIKVKAYWFHVRERGIFGAIFGTLISVGIYLAFDWGQFIANRARVDWPGGGWLHAVLRRLFGFGAPTVDATWAVFFVPAVILLGWAALDLWLIKDAPDGAGFPPYDTHDASSGQMHVELTAGDLLKKVFTTPLLVLIAIASLTSGVFRYGMAQWYTTFAGRFVSPGSAYFVRHWGWLLCVSGIIGSFASGIASDRLFHSRRGPPTAFLAATVLVATLLMAGFLFSAPVVAGISAVLIWASGVGITSLMSGTAAADFGGRKATATCAGVIDGFAYLGSGIQSFAVGYLSNWNWHWWPLFLSPFAILGIAVAVRIWHSLPPATQKYIAEVEMLSKTPAKAPARS